MAKTYSQAKADLTAEPQAYANTISGQIERIEDAKTVIVTKLNDLVSLETDSNIDDAAIALDAIENRGSPTATISAGTTYTIQAGYYAGGSVSYEQGGSDYLLQTKTVTPTKATQTVGPDQGYYGLSSVTVNPIPVAYQDVTVVTQANYATSAEILTGKSVVGRDGTVINGSMANIGPASASVMHTLDATFTNDTYTNISYTIPQGYHSGLGTVVIVPETVSVTPTEASQTLRPTSGKVITEVVVSAIDKATYLTSWTSDATAVAGDILTSKTAYVNGVKVTGTMTNHSSTWDGEQSDPIDHTLTTATGQTSITVPAGYHNGYGVVKIVPQDKSISVSDITSASASWTVTADSGNVLRTVTVAPLPAGWADTSSATATAGDILSPKTAYVNGSAVTGTIATVASYSEDATAEILACGPSATTTLKSFGTAYYQTGGSVTMTNAIYNRLASI